MKMRKKLAALLAAAMIASVMPMSVFADSTNRVDKVITVAKDSTIKVGDAPGLKIKMKDDLTTNLSFYLELTGAEWAPIYTGEVEAVYDGTTTTYNTPVDNGIYGGLVKLGNNPGTATDYTPKLADAKAEAKKIAEKATGATATAPSKETVGFTSDDRSLVFAVKTVNGTVDFEAYRESATVMALRAIGPVTMKFAQDDELIFPLVAKITDAEANVKVRKHDTEVSNSEHVFAVSDGAKAKAKVVVGDVPGFYRTTEIAPITLEELYANAVKDTDLDKRWFTLELRDTDFTFNVDPAKAVIEGERAYRNYSMKLDNTSTGAQYTLSKDKTRLGVRIDDTINGARERGNFILKGVEVVAAKDAKEGKVKAAIASTTLFAEEAIVVVLAEYKKVEASKPLPPSAGSGGSSSSTTPSKPTEAQKSAKEIITTVTNITNGTANITVSQDEVKDSIKKAQAEAKKNGTEKDGVSMEIKADTKSSLVENVSAKLSKGSIDEIVKENVKELSVSSELGTINLDLETLKTIQSQVGGEVEISAKKVDISTLSEEVKAIIGGRPVYDFSITDASGTKVTEFGKGKVSITIPYTLDIKEKSENVVVYYIDDEGKLEEMLISAYDNKTGMLSFVTDHFSKFAVGYKEEVETEAIEADEVEADLSETSLTDIASHWAKKDIEFVIARGLFSGTAEGVFSPNMSMTRGMLVTVLGRFDEVSLTSYTNSSFNDVKSDAYYMPSIEWAREAGIVRGVSATEFSPNQAISREQLAVIITNYAKTLDFDLPDLQAENSFADNQEISDYAKVAVKQMQMAGIISGKNDNKFDPTGTATRAEVSAVMRRLVEMIETN
ncbi:MAG TPA: S-layer homology domain-containing protein [Epulopiscium sp.]|nr:S-layer homology domain-containing protein [Candidatus Epulonipiscium sp.]